VGWGKVAYWSTKAAISLKCVKIEEKLLWTEWTAYRNSPTFFRAVPFPTPYGALPLEWRFATPPSTAVENRGKTSAHRGIPGGPIKTGPLCIFPNI